MNIRTNIARTLLTLASIALCASSANAQVQVAPMTLVRAQFLSNTGVPVAAGCVNFFATGTSTPQAIYADSTGTSQLANPLTLDAAGEASVWMSNTGYDIVLNTGVANTACSVSLGTQLWRENNKNPFAIINGGSNYIVASGTVDPSNGVAGMLAYRTDIPCFRGFTTIWDCFMELTLVQSPTNKTIDISANTLKNSTNTAGHYPRNNGTQYADSALLQSDVVSLIANSGSIATVTNQLAKLNATNPSTVQVTGIGDTNALGICVSGCSLTGTASIQTIGIASCIFDNATLANDLVVISNSTNTGSPVQGNCHDAGLAITISNVQVLGRVLSTNVGAGTYQVFLFGPEDRTPNVTIASANLSAQAANITSTPLFTPTQNGFYRFSCYTVITQAATSSSTLPNCNAVWTDADSSISETDAITATSTVNTIGTVGFSTSASATTPNSIGIFAKAGVAISYSASSYSTSGVTSMQYAIHVRLEGPL